MFKIKPDIESLKGKLWLMWKLYALQIRISVALCLLAKYGCFSEVNWRLAPFVWLYRLLDYPWMLIENYLPWLYHLPSVVWLVLIAPIGEEIEFRGPLLLVLKLKRTGDFLYDRQYLLWTIILASSVLFGAFHLHKTFCKIS